MGLPERKQLPHEVPLWVPDGAVYFLTICAAKRGDVGFTKPETAAALIKATKHYQEINRWHVPLFLVMPDHVHGVFCMPSHHEMKKTVSSWKSFTAKHTGIRWQRDFFEHRLRSGESFDAKALYIRMNPVRAGLCAKPEEWPYVWPPAR